MFHVKPRWLYLVTAAAAAVAAIADAVAGTVSVWEFIVLAVALIVESLAGFASDRNREKLEDIRAVLAQRKTMHGPRQQRLSRPV
jgi:Flp pilus assembly protein TadB